MKGVEATTGKRLSEVVGEFVDENKTPVAVWVGPGQPQDYVRGIPNCMVIDSNNHDIKEKLVNEFTSDLIRFYLGTDLIGSEIGAAAKNVIGIAAGMLDGLNYTSLKGALMARGTREIARLIKALGGNEMSAYGLCHLGDYEATLFSKWSHNRMYGESFAKGDRFTKLAEGVMTSKALYKLGQEYGVDLPIVESVYKVLFDGTDIKEALGTLFMRSVKKEFDETKEPLQRGGSYRQPSSGKHPDDGDDECGKEVGDTHVRQAEEVRADAEDQDVADGTEALEGGGRHDGLEEACG